MDIVEQVRQNLKETLRYINDRIVGGVEVGIVLGSGLGKLVEGMQDARSFSYDEIPHFPRPTTAGHAGNLVIGTLAGKRVAVMQGRFHYYEGYTSVGISFPIRVFKALGARTLIVTCAVGALHGDLSPGDMVAIIDHVNMMGINPLVGPNDEMLGPRFVDMTDAYDPELIAVAKSVAGRAGISLKEGVYVGVLGPSYETPAEVRFLSTVGDIVGMSTVPEVIAARHSGLRVLGLAVVTNTPGAQHGISHDEVLAEAHKASDRLITLITGVLESI